jgi:hypothetical protein
MPSWCISGASPQKEFVRLRLITILVLLDILSIQSGLHRPSNLLFVGTPVLHGLGFAVGSVIPIFLICAFMVRAYSGPRDY